MDRNKQDFAALQFEAAVMYVKNGVSAKEISRQLNVSMPTIQKWNKTGNWEALRPDLSILNEYRAADMFVVKQMSTGEIAMKLNVSEMQVKMWVHINGWEAARLVEQAQADFTSIITEFAHDFTTWFPKCSTEIEVAKNNFIKKYKALK
jgi:uncharacterized protein YjcR